MELTQLKETAKEFCPLYGIVYFLKKDSNRDYTKKHPIRSHITMAYHGTYIALMLSETMIFGLEKLASSLS